MSTLEIAKKYVELCKAHQHQTILETLFSPDAVSLEARCRRLNWSALMTGRMLRRLTGAAIAALLAACETGPTPPQALAPAQLHLTALVSAPVTNLPF